MQTADPGDTGRIERLGALGLTQARSVNLRKQTLLPHSISEAWLLPEDSAAIDGITDADERGRRFTGEGERPPGNTET